MSGRSAAAVLAGLVVAGVCAGCGSGDRPAELAVDGVQPCELIDAQTLSGLQVTAEPSPNPVVEGSGEEGSSCDYRPQYGGTVTVSVVTNNGIDRWTGSGEGETTGIELPRVEGYRAIRLSGPSYEPGPHGMCTLYVDVADGQSLRAEAGPTDADAPPSCDISRRFAEAAVASLAQRTG